MSPLAQLAALRKDGETAETITFATHREYQEWMSTRNG